MALNPTDQHLIAIRAEIFALRVAVIALVRDSSADVRDKVLQELARVTKQADGLNEQAPAGINVEEEGSHQFNVQARKLASLIQGVPNDLLQPSKE